MKAKREKIEKCEVCQAKFSVVKPQHQCKRCLRAVCSDCASEQAVILRIAHQDSAKHRICLACKQELNQQKRQRDDQKLQFSTDSLQAKKWLQKLGGTQMATTVYTAAQNAQLISTEDKNQLVQDIRILEQTYEKERANLNFSWFDMVYYLTETVDKKLQFASCKRIIQSFLTKHPQVGFTKEMIHIVIYLLSYCAESTAYFLFSTLYNTVVPEYLYPGKFKLHSSFIDEDIKFILELLKQGNISNINRNAYNLTDLKQQEILKKFLEHNYAHLCQGILADHLSWEGYFILIDSLIEEQTAFQLQNSIALICKEGVKQIALNNEIEELRDILIKHATALKVRENLQQKKNESMKAAFAKRSNTNLTESVTEKIKRLEAENLKLKKTMSFLGDETESQQSEQSFTTRSETLPSNSQIASLQQFSLNQEKKVKELSQQIEQKDEDIDSLKSQNEQLQILMTLAEKNEREATEKLDQLTKDYEKLNQEMDQLKLKQSSLLQEVEQSKNKVFEANKESEDLKQKLDTLLNEMKAQNNNHQIQISLLNEQLLITGDIEKNGKYKELRKKHEKQEQRLTELEDIEQKLKVKESENTILLAKVADIEKMLNSDQGGIVEDKAQLQKKFEEMSQQIDQTRKDLEGEREDKEALMKKNLEVNQEIEQLKKQLSSFNQPSTSEKIPELISQIEALKKEIKSSQARQSELESIILEKEERCLQFTGEVDKLRSEIDTQKSQSLNGHSKIALEISNLKIVNLEEKVDKMVKSEKLLIGSFEKLESENRKLKLKMGQMNFDIVEQIQFLRSCQPSQSEVEKIESILMQLNAKQGPFMESLIFILVIIQNQQI